MTLLHLAVIVAAAGVAIIAARRRSPAVAIVAASVVVRDVGRALLASLVFVPERARLLALVGGDEWVRAPFSGGVRWAYHVEQAGYLAGPASVVALACWVCLRSRRGALAVVVGWATSAAVTAVAYPTVSSLAWAPYPLEHVYRAWHVLCGFAAGAALLAWARRREPRTPVVTVVAILATAELLIAGSGPYAWGGADGIWPGARWALAQIIYLTAHAAAAIILVRADDLDHGGGGNGRSQV